MKTELGSLATARYVKTDDLLKNSPQLTPWPPEVGIAPQLSDAELATLAMMQAMPGFTSEARWLRHARAHLRHLFPYLPQRPGYNKRLRKASELIRCVTRTLAVDTTLCKATTCGSRTQHRWSVAAPVRPSNAPTGREFEQQLAELDIRLLRPARKGEAERAGSQLFKPLWQVIESVNETFKGQLGSII